MPNPPTITAAQVEVTPPDTTAITNPALASLTQTNKPAAAALLSTDAVQIDPADLSLDAIGRVIVKNRAFSTTFPQTVQVADLNMCPGDGGIHIG